MAEIAALQEEILDIKARLKDKCHKDPVTLRVEKVRKAYDYWVQAIAKVEQSINEHLAFISSETKQSQKAILEYERLVDKKKKSIAKMSEKSNSKWNSLKLLSKNKKLKQKVGEFEQHFRDIISKIEQSEGRLKTLKQREIEVMNMGPTLPEQQEMELIALKTRSKNLEKEIYDINSQIRSHESEDETGHRKWSINAGSARPVKMEEIHKRK